MKKEKRIIIFLGLGLIIYSLLFTLPVLAQSETEIQPEELEIKTPQVLPISGVYPVKEFFRKIRLFFAFSPVKRAELRLKFANEKLMEVKELAKDEKNKEIIEKTLVSYQDELEKLKNETEKLAEQEKEKFLEKYANQVIKQQMVLENIASQVKGEVYEKILANREKHLERFKEVMEKIENKEIIKELESKIKSKEIEIMPSIRISPRKELGGFCGWSTKASCKTDDDCLKGGCSNQVCQGKNEKGIITTCEWKECYNADAYGLKCGCFKNKCQWIKK